jgi:hypothetical protein
VESSKNKNGKTQNSLDYEKLINIEALLSVQKCKSHEFYLIWRMWFMIFCDEFFVSTWVHFW